MGRKYPAAVNQFLIVRVMTTISHYLHQGSTKMCNCLYLCDARHALTQTLSKNIVCIKVNTKILTCKIHGWLAQVSFAMSGVSA